MNASELGLNITFARIAIWSSSSPSRYKFKRTESGKQSLRDVCRPMFIAVLSTTAKMWKQPKCPWRDEWIKKIWYIIQQAHYSDFLKSGILTCAIMYINLEDIMLSKISQSQKDKYCMVPLIWGTCAKSLPSCPTLCDPMDCNPPGSSVHGIL